MLFARITATAPLSEAVAGLKMAEPGRRGQNTSVTAQVTPETDEDFEVSLEADAGGGFEKIATWDQDSDTKTSIIPISLMVRYRFRHVSGTSCQVRMVG